MTYTSTLADTSYAFTTQAIVRLDPSPGHEAAVPALSSVKAEPLAASRTDEADISHASILLAHALTLSDVRIDKVASLQQAIANGTYRVSSSDLAAKLTLTLQS